jgi:hypothetical protein
LYLCGIILYNNNEPKNSIKHETVINNIIGIPLRFFLYVIIAAITINTRNGKIYLKNISRIYPIPSDKNRMIRTKMDIKPFILSPAYPAVYAKSQHCVNRQADGVEYE